MKTLSFVLLFLLSALAQAQPTRERAPSEQQYNTMITFKVNSAELSPATEKNLKEFVAAQNISVSEVKIQSQAAEQEDISLAAQRAETVKKVFTDAKVKESYITVENKGNEKNIGACKSSDTQCIEYGTTLSLTVHFTK